MANDTRDATSSTQNTYLNKGMFEETQFRRHLQHNNEQLNSTLAIFKTANFNSEVDSLDLQLEEEHSQENITHIYSMVRYTLS